MISRRALLALTAALVALPRRARAGEAVAWSVGIDGVAIVRAKGLTLPARHEPLVVRYDATPNDPIPAWFERAKKGGSDEAKTVALTGLDANGRPVARWALTKVRPTKLATEGGVVVVALAYASMTRVT